MARARAVLVLVAVGVLVVPGPAAGLTTVLEDPTGDVKWQLWDGTELPEAADPVREARRPDGTGVDFEALRIGENRTHIIVEVDLAALPLTASECSGPPFRRQTASCAYHYDIRWSYLRETDPWGPPVKLDWDILCFPNGRVCGELVEVEVGGFGGELDEDSDPVNMTFRRVDPDVARVTFHKGLFRNATEFDATQDTGDLAPARLCRGDVFANFRVATWAADRGVTLERTYFEDNRFWDDGGRETYDTPAYVIQHDSPACPEDDEPEASAATSPTTSSAVPGLLAPLALAALGTGWILRGRREEGR